MRTLDLPQAESKFWGLDAVALDMKVESDVPRILLDPAIEMAEQFFGIQGE